MDYRSDVGLIFDMDGVLVDTEPYHCASWIETLREYGITLTGGEYNDLWTRKGYSIWDYVKSRHLDFDPAALRVEKTRRYHAMLRENMIAIPGAEEALAELRVGFKIALASSAYRDDVDLIMELTGFGRFMDTTVTTTECGKRKPDPAGFLMAADRLGVQPARCLVVEDAEKGVKAATAAGMRSVVVWNELTMDHNFSGAELVLSGISDLTPELVADIFVD